MRCSHCQANNPEGTPRCVQCGAVFSGADDAPTVGGEHATVRGPEPLASPPGSSPGAPMAAGGFNSTTLEPGGRFGPRYRIESFLGSGGMGTVYKAHDEELGRLVAIKLMRPELTAEPAILQRFKQELLLASRVSHKNILRIHDLGEVGGIKFISMAYVDGEDLGGVLKREGRLPVDRAVSIGRQLCAALEAAHAEGVIHRDLKPQNVLVDRAGNAYVSDFGLAKSLEAEAIGMTRTGQLLGTPRYMAPEQLEGNPADHRTDLYALGLILYEMVTGNVPFEADSALQLMFQRLKEKPKDPRQLNPGVPDYLARVILRCLESDPERRYASAGEMLRELELQRASAVRWARVGLPRSTRGRWVLAGGVLLVLAVLPLLPRFWKLAVRSRARTGATAETSAVARQRYLAVLPLRILGDPASLGYIAEGLVEALSAKLFELKGVHVASSSSAERASKMGSLEKIGKELGVTLIVHGTLQGTGEKIRIILSLEDLAGGRRLWTQEFSGVAQDLLTLEDQVYARLVDALEIRPGNDELARAQSHPTENVEAYDLYLRGRSTIRGGRNLKDVQAAIRFYEEALKRDPQFAFAYAGLADASLQMYRLKKDSSWTGRALAAAQQARRLNENLPEAHFSLGTIYAEMGRNAEAAAELKHALELAPNSDEGHRRLGDNYLALGRKQEAIRAFQRAVELNPYYWVNHNWLGNAYFQMGEYEKALAAYRRMTDLEPDNSFGHLNIGAVYFQQGKYSECVVAFRKALEIQPDASTYSNLGVVYFYLRKYDEALKMFEKAVEMQPNDQKFVGNLADAYRWSGEKEKALAAYERAIALAYEELRVNPRAASILGNLALYYAKKGDAGQSSRLIRRARSIDPNDVELIYDDAVVRALAGRSLESLRALREALQKGYSTEQAKNDPELGSLQGRPEFEGLIKEFTRKAN